MDSREFAGALVIAVLVALLVLMYAGWRRRQRSQSGLPRPHTVPDDAGTASLHATGLYVATTLVDEPLNRIAVAGLGYRGAASLAVLGSGVALSIAGETDAYIPATDILRVERSTWTIDRVVERDGLLKLTWLLGDTIVDSYLRVSGETGTTPLISAIAAIIPSRDESRNEEV